MDHSVVTTSQPKKTGRFSKFLSICDAILNLNDYDFSTLEQTENLVFPRPPSRDDNKESKRPKYRPRGGEEEVVEGSSESNEACSSKDKVDWRQVRKDIGREEAKHALVKYASRKLLLSKNTAKRMKITDISSFVAYHYIAETFKQIRYIAPYKEAYNIMEIPFGNNSIESSPNPWDIAVELPVRFFVEKEDFKEVPNTARVKDCEECCATGVLSCPACAGSGKECCSFCYPYRNPFQSNSARYYLASGCCYCLYGEVECEICQGGKTLRCNSCQGTGKLKHYDRMTVRWRVLREEKILCKDNALPLKMRDRIKEALFNENVVYRSEGTFVKPLTRFPESDLQQVSSNVLSKQVESSNDGLVVRQRQCVKAIPITKVDAAYKKKILQYYVYGNEHQVHSIKFPKGPTWALKWL